MLPNYNGFLKMRRHSGEVGGREQYDARKQELRKRKMAGDKGIRSRESGVQIKTLAIIDLQVLPPSCRWSHAVGRPKYRNSNKALGSAFQRSTKTPLKRLIDRPCRLEGNERREDELIPVLNLKAFAF